MFETKFVAFECTGCGRLTRDPIADMKKLNDGGAVSCCPERDMQPVIMYRCDAGGTPEIPFHAAAIWHVALQEAIHVLAETSNRSAAIKAIGELDIKEFSPKFGDGEIQEIFASSKGRFEDDAATIPVNQFWVFAANLITITAMRVASEYTKPEDEDNWADPMETKDAD